MYQQFKANVLGKVIGDGQCVALVVNNSSAYIETLYPGVSWPNIIAPVPSAKDLAGKGNQYLQWIENNHNDPNQVPVQGDVMVFGATPQAGYTNQFNNPDGHTGICDSADGNGYYSLLQQNSPSSGSPVNVKQYAWRFRPCIGWYRPLNANANPVSPPPVTAEHTIHYAQTIGPVHLYKVGGPYIPAQAKAVLMPSMYPGGITETIVASKGNGIYTIDTQMFGQGDVWTNGTDVVIA